MNSSLAGHAPVANTRPRLADADRALILAVAERELAQGKIGIEEYEYLQDLCRVHPGAALVQRLLRLTGRGGVARFPFGQPGDPLLCVLPPHMETIPVSSVVGSLDRASHLDRRFRPIHGGRARLESIRQAMAAGVAFPPIEVYRLDGVCYVSDGHHRVAAALQVGQLYLDAVVTESWPQREGIAHPVEAARVAFGLHTGLHALRFSTEERYGQALHQIHEHRWYLGERGRVVSLTEAAQDWYQVTYLPVVQQMVAEGVSPLHRLGEIGDRYCDLCELKERISRERGQEVGFAEALGLWTASQPGRPRTRLRRRLREVRLI